jgi:hypothetical protein
MTVQITMTVSMEASKSMLNLKDVIANPHI